LTTLKEWERLKQTPIASAASIDWEQVAKVPVEDNGEALVPASLYPARVLTRPQYYLQGIPGAMADCYVRLQVWHRLRKAAELMPEGYKLVILDGYRPLGIQVFLFERLLEEFRKTFPQKSQSELDELTAGYVARPSDDPKCPPPHNTGGAVDLTIADAQGRLLGMGGGFDESTPYSATSYFETLMPDGCKPEEWQTRCAENRRGLYHIMTRAGFHNYAEEWWHYDFGDQLWAGSAANSGPKKAIYGPAVPPAPPGIL